MTTPPPTLLVFFFFVFPHLNFSVSLVSPASTSVSPPATVSQFLFLHLLLEGDTPYTHTPLTLDKQLVLETSEGERKGRIKNKYRKWKNALIQTERNRKKNEEI